MSSNYIIDPRIMLKNAPPDSPHWALADAFDAATNGMENPEAFSRLLSCNEAAFLPWKILVGAVCALYSDDTQTCLRFVEEMPETSPPAILKPLFLTWSGSRDSARTGKHREILEASAAVTKLYKNIIYEQHPLSLLAEQAEEALNQGMLDHFETLMFKILRELHEQPRSDGPLLALRYAAKCLKDLDAAGYSLSDFFSTILRALGKADGFLVLALSLLGQDTEAALAAFTAALEADDPLFLAGSIREIVQETVDILKGSEKKRKRSPKKKTEQLELF